ncbi:TonB-dependent receptor plug domain-containing protein [Chitinophaga arvensicola]|uniref:Outer membrane receptor for ferrienterochelin and colicins n=1 Tax=Chitinophaga arvensicola TaxID=29529 RepID=A0A1I0SBS5_9BACT|nr:TonB-dependent receptor [Chitinophaga arvensicola]SEW54240.1 outer membrane receptor for ferrienterochelin and colicins [Chitinophaga arvensicola]
MYRYLFLLTCVMRVGTLFAQTDTAAGSKVLQEVVVTATRNEQLLSKVPVPVTVIHKQQIQSMGAVLLQQVLAEQTGLFVTSNHGTGVQMQGLEAEYTLILLDGEPLIGRTAGTLDLSRIVVSNIERIEIIKGPVSSLYGSDALAGVINIITSNNNKQGTSSISGRYGSNDTWTLDGNTRIPYGKGTFSAGVNAYNSGGYTLGSGTGSPTVAPFKAYTAQSRWQHDWSGKWHTILSGRYYEQRYNSYFADTKGLVDDIGKEKDLNGSLQLIHTPNKNFRQTLRLYYSRYATNEDMNYQQDKSLYDASFFTQQYLKPEYQADWTLHPKHQLTAGMGYVHESLEATRYDERMAFNTGYVFVQENWKPADAWNILIGGRFDTHNQYPSQFSPKLSVSYQLSPNWRVLGTVGRGYRAPDFRQLYLHFNNAAVGYTVVGTKLAAEILKEMTAQGQIKQVNIDPEQLKNLDAESSWSYNLGVDGKLFPLTTAKVNFFYNSVKNLIDTRAIAVKTNDLAVYSYINVNSITTAGAEAELGQSIGKYWQVAAGYQYLRSRDNELYKKVKDGKVYTKDPATGETRALKRSEYFGLFNRSHHSGNLKIAYIQPRLGIDANARLLYRSKYGFTDENGNNTPDTKSEFVPGYATVNLAAAKYLFKRQLRIQGTIENIFNYTDPNHITTLPGRIYSVGLTWNFYHHTNH